MRRQLNGWQRLWIVLSILYLLPVIGFTATVFPKAGDYISSRVYKSLKAVDDYDRPSHSGFHLDVAGSIRMQHDHGISDEEIIADLHDKWGGKVDFSKIEAEYGRNIDGLPAARAKIIGVALLVWVIPVVVFYLLGLVIVWIIRGFRRVNP